MELLLRFSMLHLVIARMLKEIGIILISLRQFLTGPLQRMWASWGDSGCCATSTGDLSKIWKPDETLRWSYKQGSTKMAKAIEDTLQHMKKVTSNNYLSISHSAFKWNVMLQAPTEGMCSCKINILSLWKKKFDW